jgi:hypothetical protein
MKKEVEVGNGVEGGQRAEGGEEGKGGGVRCPAAAKAGSGETGRGRATTRETTTKTRENASVSERKRAGSLLYCPLGPESPSREPTTLLVALNGTLLPPTHYPTSPFFCHVVG